MFNHINKQLNHLENTSRNLFFNTKNILGSLSSAACEIKNLSNVRFLLCNSFLINGIQLVLPFATYSFIKLLLKTQIKTSCPDFSENEYAIFAANLIDNTLYAVLFTRFKLKNIAFNTTATIGATRVLHEEFSDDDLHLLCLNCKKEKNHLSNEISLVVHYLIGGVTITVAEAVVSCVPYIGALAAFVLDAYWRGFVIFQYPLTRENICAEHKISILMQDRLRLILFGLFYALIELALMDQVTRRVSGIVSERVVLTAVSNLLTLFSLIHVHNLIIPIPPSNDVLSKHIPFDPVTAAWSISIIGTQMISKFILYLASNSGNKQFLYLEKMKLLWPSLTASPLFYVPVTFLIDLIIVTELKSLKEFSRAPALRPYMISFLEDADALLKTANDINDHPITQLVHYSLKIPFMSHRVTAWAANLAQSKIGIEPAFTKTLVKLIQLIHLNENLSDIQKKVEEVYKKSLASHNKNSWHKLLGFGSSTPNSWFIYNRDFVKIKTRTVTPAPSPTDSTTATILQGLHIINPYFERPAIEVSHTATTNLSVTEKTMRTSVRKSSANIFRPENERQQRHIEDDYHIVTNPLSTSNNNGNSMKY